MAELYLIPGGYCRAGYGGGVVGVWGGRSVEVARERRSLENYPGMFVVVICNWTGSTPLLHPLAGLHNSLSSPVRLSFPCKKQTKRTLL